MLLSTLLQYCSSPSCEAAAHYLLPIGSVGGDLFIVAGRTIGVKCHHLSKKSRVIGEAYVGIGSFLYQTHNNKGLGMYSLHPTTRRIHRGMRACSRSHPRQTPPPYHLWARRHRLGPAGWSRLPPSGKYNAPHYRRRPIDDNNAIVSANQKSILPTQMKNFGVSDRKSLK